jgi:hypothetical protein
MKTHVWETLGIKDMTFHLSTRPDMRETLVNMSHRSAEDKVSAKPEKTVVARLPGLKLEGKELRERLEGKSSSATHEE